MCGISALVSAGSALDPRAIVAMTDIVSHRGPDGEGFVAFLGKDLSPQEGKEAGPDVRVALGHRRLAIVDLSPGGAQPMADPGRDAWIVYNGEIYNHIELRRELAGLGHAFRSQSDTEVMLAAYRQWGVRCMERFNGMFAFILVDRARRKVLAARDRFGVKPLYYWKTPAGAWAFASEIKQFTVLEGWRAQLNGARARDFLAYGACDHTAETLFSGVRQLRGGEAMEIDLASGAARTSRWYELQAETFHGSPAEAIERFRDLLTDSVRLRLRADVPVGSCLSGGLDSSSIVCIANGLLREGGGAVQQKTFTAVSDSARYDERRHAEAVVAATGVAAATVKPEPDGLFRALEAITWHQDEPFGSTSIFAQWEVFRLAAAAGVRVMLDGQGADELLGGYPVFHGSRLAGLLGAGRVGGFFAELQSLRARGFGTGALARQTAVSLAPGWMLSAARGSDAPDWMNLGGAGVHPSDAEAGARRSIRSLSRAQLLTTSLPMLLHWEDRDSMAHSLEARVPFLDYRLVEFALGLPDELKIERGVTKVVLREAMRGVLPEPVRARTDKLGFQTPEDEWLRAHAGEFRRALEGSIESSGGIIRPTAKQVLEDMISGRSAFSYLAWRLIAFGAWMRRFSVAA